MDNVEERSVTEYVILNLKNGIDPTDISCHATPLSDKINELLSRRNIPLTVLAELSAINRATLYKLMSGAISPGRNIIIRLGMELHASLDEMQDLLKCANCATLSGSRLRDIFIISAILKQEPIADLEEALIRHNMDSIYGR